MCVQIHVEFASTQNRPRHYSRYFDVFLMVSGYYNLWITLWAKLRSGLDSITKKRSSS